MKKSHPRADLTELVNEVVREIHDSYTLGNQGVGDDFTIYETTSMLQVAYDCWHSEIAWQHHLLLVVAGIGKLRETQVQPEEFTEGGVLHGDL